MEQHLLTEVAGVGLQIHPVAYLTNRQLDGQTLAHVALVGRGCNQDIGLSRFSCHDVEASTFSEGLTIDVTYDVALHPRIGAGALGNSLIDTEGFVLGTVVAGITIFCCFAFLNLEVLQLPGGGAALGGLEPEADMYFLLIAHLVGQLDLA